MKKIEFNVYTYDELNEESKKTAIKTYRNKYSDMHIEDDLRFFKEDIEEQLQELKFNVMNIYYSLSSSQGDGVMFEFKVSLKELLNVKDFKETLSATELKKLNRILKIDDVIITGKHSNSSYYHSNTVNLDWGLVSYNSYDFEKVSSFIEKIIQGNFKNYYDKLCSSFKKNGYNIIDKYYEDDFYKEYLKNNEDILFLANGNYYGIEGGF